MQKPSLSRSLISLGAALALAPGWLQPESTAQKLHAQRGRAPTGKRWIFSSVFIPGGANANVSGARVRNPKVAAQMNAMHDAWFAAKFESKPASPT